MKKIILKTINLGLITGFINAILLFPFISHASDIFDVSDYMLFNYIPQLILPFLFAILLIGILTRFIRNMNNI